MSLRNKKTGKTIDGCLVVCEYDDGERFSVKDKPVFNSLAELNEEWEDYAPKEPLIKDEDVQNIIRHIASTYGSDLIYATNFGMGDITIKFSFENAGSTYLCFSLNTGVHISDGSYTIAELCGTPPEPIEPTFIDLDERIKDKEEEC